MSFPPAVPSGGPTLTTDNVVQFIHAKYLKGSTPNREIQWYRDKLPESTVQAQITSSLSIVAYQLGSSIWTSNDPYTMPAVARLALVYAAAWVLTAFSGGLIITGFDKVHGDLALHASERGKIYMDVITPLLAEADQIMVKLTQFNIRTSRGSIAAP